VARHVNLMISANVWVLAKLVETKLKMYVTFWAACHK